MRAMLLGVSSYNFTDRQSGKNVSGKSVYVAVPMKGEGKEGFQAEKLSLGEIVLPEIKSFPAWVEIETWASGGKNRLESLVLSK